MSKKDGNKKFYIKDSLALMLGLELNQSKTYRLPLEKQIEFYNLKANEGILDACENVGVNPSDAPMLWLKTKHESVRVTNPLFKTPEQKSIEELFDGFLDRFKDLIKDVKPQIINRKSPEVDFDKLVFTDVHIGMEPNPDGYSLYGGKWNEKTIQSRFAEMLGMVICNKKSNVLYIDDLGDYLDGWDGKTVRREHDLPQNMDNQKAFDIAVEMKIYLVENLLGYYDYVNLRNICEDNHAGAFGYVVNSAVKMYLEAKYPNRCVVTNQRKFIDHYTVNNFTFITSHGKDSKNLRFGFKPFLDSQQIEKIHNYIFENRLNQQGKQIEFLKGDSHQCIFDESSSDLFSYYNYPALSPSSNWVQTNFKKGKSGFFFYNYLQDTKVTYSHYFGWEQ